MPVIAIRTVGDGAGTHVRPLLGYFYIIPVVWIAWAGGVAFAASLGYLVYFYLWTLGRSTGHPGDRIEHVLLNISLFSVFALHHSLFARARLKRLVTRLVPAAYERTLYVWIASVLAIAMCALWQPVAGLAYRVDGWMRLPFWVVQALGVVLVLRAASAISALELAGIRQAAGRATGGGLKIVGPFRSVRHPIYLGWMLMVCATPEMTANRMLFAALSTLYLILAIPWEEKSLVADHGDQYRAYQRSVRWRLVPGIW